MRLYISTLFILLFHSFSYSQELKWLIPLTDKFEEVSPFSDGLARVKVKGKYNSKYGFINTKGETVIPFKYDQINNFSEGLALYGNFGFWNFIDTTGKLVLSNLQYDYVEEFNYGRALVQKKYKAVGLFKKRFSFKTTGYINKKGKYIVPPIYKNRYENTEKDFITMITENNKSGVLNETGKIIISFEYNGLGRVSEGLIAAKKNEKSGFINLKNEIVVPFEFEWVNYFSHGLALVRKENCYYYIDKKGNLKINLEDDDSWSFEENLAIIKRSTKNGQIESLIDTSGVTIIPFNKYDGISEPYSENRIAVRKDGKWGYIDYKDSLLIPMQYSSAGSFLKGIADVRINNKVGFINLYGKIVMPIEYDAVIRSLSNNTIWLKKGNKWGLVEAPSSD